MVDYTNINKELDKIVIEFLNTNEGNAYTPEAIFKRVKNNIVKEETLEYFKKYTKGVLNRLAFSYKISMHKHEGIMYYLKLNE